jgi:hypothetical protein
MTASAAAVVMTQATHTQQRRVLILHVVGHRRDDVQILRDDVQILRVVGSHDVGAPIMKSARSRRNIQLPIHICGV